MYLLHVLLFLTQIASSVASMLFLRVRQWMRIYQCLYYEVAVSAYLPNKEDATSQAVARDFL